MNTVLEISKNYMGEGSEDLGKILLLTYLTLRLEENRLPAIICLYNRGVDLMFAEGDLLTVLQKIEDKGVKILGCKTCLNKFSYDINNLKIGQACTMLDIISIQDAADKIIKI